MNFSRIFIAIFLSVNAQALTVKSTTTLWETGDTIKFFFENVPLEYQIEIQEVASEWTRYANLNFEFFVYGTTPMDISRDVIVSLVEGRRSSQASTGRSDFGVDTIILSIISSLMNPRNRLVENRRFKILHEFGHILGASHEHQRSDNDLGVTDAIIDEICSSIMYRQRYSGCLRAFNVNELLELENDYDSGSIMHYPPEKYNEVLGRVVTNTELEYNYKNVLSLQDKIDIAKLYPGRISEAEIRELHAIESQELDNNLVERMDNGNCRVDYNPTMLKPFRVIVNQRDRNGYAQYGLYDAIRKIDLRTVCRN